MNRSEVYGPHGKGADSCELTWELPDGLWPAGERRAIEPPPPARWRGAAVRPLRTFADLPAPPRAVGASPPLAATPAWAPHVESFFSPRDTGTWARDPSSDSAPWRPPTRPLAIPIPPVPKIPSAPPRAERARLMLHPEDDCDADSPLERRLFGLSVRRWLCACGAMALGVVSIGIAIDWSPADGAAKPAPRAPSTGPRAKPPATTQPKAQSVGLPATTSLVAARSGPSQPARVAKRTVKAAVARGSFSHRARARPAERETQAPEPSGAVEPPPAVVAERAVTRAVLIASPRPRYPELARRRGIGGSVVVRFKIDEYGLVRDAAIEHSSPAGVFDRAALQAIENTRYRPRIEDGAAVTTPTARKRFTFHVRKAS